MDSLKIQQCSSCFFHQQQQQQPQQQHGVSQRHRLEDRRHHRPSPVATLDDNGEPPNITLCVILTPSLSQGWLQGRVALYSQTKCRGIGDLLLLTIGNRNAGNRNAALRQLKKRLLMMCEVSDWSLEFPFGLLPCALEYWNADQGTGPSTKEYAQWEHIHVAMETLLTPKRNIYDRIIEAEPAILCQRRTTRRAIFQWRSEVHPAIEQRVQQLQDSEHWNTGPATLIVAQKPWKTPQATAK